MKEFVFVIPKKKCRYQSLDDNILSSLKGYLLEPKYWLSFNDSLNKNVFGFVSSLNPVANENIFFDGEAVYNEKFYLSSFELPSSVDLNDFKLNARGSYSIVKINSAGEIFAFNDQLGNYPLFYLDNEFFTGVTNNLLLLQSFLAKAFNYNLSRGSEHVVNEMVFTSPLDVASYQETYFIPFDKEVFINRSGELMLQEKRGSDYYFNCNLSREKLLQLCVKDIKENIKAIAESDIPMKVADVTGGMDSRMVLAAIIGSGYKDHFFFNTNGSYPNPDANVSNYLIKKYNLKKTKIKDGCGSGSGDLIDRFFRFPYLSGGVKNNLDREPLVSSRNNQVIKMGGGNSEFYKGLYSKNIDRIEGELDIDKITDLMVFKPYSLSDDAFLAKKQELKQIFLKWKLEGHSFESVLDRFYVEHRGRYHNGTCEHWSRPALVKVHPLYSANTIRLAFSQASQQRINGNITFDLMCALYTPLVYEPFEKRVWPRNAYAGGIHKEKISLVKPIALNSKKLVDIDPAILNFSVTNIDNQGKDESKEENLSFKKESEWCRAQKRLGRKWHWFTLDQVQQILKSFLKNYDFENAPFSKRKVEFLASKDLGEFRNIGEVLELHQLCLFLIFSSHAEVDSIVSSRGSLLCFDGVS